MNKYDQLMYLILNRILMCFGLRIKNDESVVFIYRVRDYTNPSKSESAHIIKLTTDVSRAFKFLKMDYEDYKKQQWNTIFDFTEYVVKHCKYLTVETIESLSKQVDEVPAEKRIEVLRMLDRFVRTLKISHIRLKEFDFLPVMIYLNLRESIVRNFFDEDEIHDQFVKIKLEHLHNTELIGKFSSKKLVTWVKPLLKKPSLAGIFSQSFVNYITQDDAKNFPRYLIDNDVNIIKKEVISYYYNLFPQTDAYRIYILEDPENNEVVE